MALGPGSRFSCELLGCVAAGRTVWSEWVFHHRPVDGPEHDRRGVIIFTVAGGQVQAARLYMEFVEAPPAG